MKKIIKKYFTSIVIILDIILWVGVLMTIIPLTKYIGITMVIIAGISVLTMFIQKKINYE